MLRTSIFAAGLLLMIGSGPAFGQGANRGGGGGLGSSTGAGGSGGSFQSGSAFQTGSGQQGGGGLQQGNSVFGNTQQASPFGNAGNPFESSQNRSRNTGRTNRRTTGNAGRSRGAGNNAFGNQGRNRGANQQQSVRTVIRIAFPRAPVNSAAQQRSIAQFVSATTLPRSSGVRVQVNSNGAAVLTGTVASRRDARLAAALASLEPGVRTVRNELQVQSSDSSDSP